MSDFRNQISQDIDEYQRRFPYINNIDKPEWAFNYWILDKFFYEDEELIEEKILDYRDLGVDAYEFYEDTKDLYLIQNKYYSDDTRLSSEYVKNDFLLRPINALKNGTYKRSEELQNIFNKYCNHSDFTVYLQIYITNNLYCEEAENYIKKFNTEYPKYRAEIYYLDDIEKKYYSDIKQNKVNLTVSIESVNNGTILNINTNDYKLENVLDAKYVFTPVTSIFRIYRDALEKNYPIFDMNIREYLGNKGVNKKIYETLLDKEDRKNFFYYNNGITLICDTMSKPETKPRGNNINVSFDVTNPQIVNGCQTVNSIYEALKNVDPLTLSKDYKDTFVMLKILQINRQNEFEETLYRNIVTFNNSQNSIDEKTFVANTGIFNRLKVEFEDKGFLLLIKQSDKNTFNNKYANVTKLKRNGQFKRN
ncbi:MAG: AIPR protein [Firmicutes bacterium ADurb.Bin193]|nr:MAG: AIPR protein [Firmicutes bacterium ADurb.Bin193]